MHIQENISILYTFASKIVAALKGKNLLPEGGKNLLPEGANSFL